MRPQLAQNWGSKLGSLECSSNMASLCGSHLPQCKTTKTTFQERHALSPRNPIYFAIKFKQIQFDFQFFGNCSKSHFFCNEKNRLSLIAYKHWEFHLTWNGKVNLLISTRGRRSSNPHGGLEDLLLPHVDIRRFIFHLKTQIKLKVLFLLYLFYTSKENFIVDEILLSIPFA